MQLKTYPLLKSYDNFVDTTSPVCARHENNSVDQMIERLTIQRTNSNHKHFAFLVGHLDHELWAELNEDQAQYDQYNKVPDLPTVVLVYVDDRPAACGCFKAYNEDTVEIKRMFVEKEFRKKGLSKIVLRELEDWAIENDFKYALLETSIHFTAAKTLYLNAGYSIIPNYDQYAGLSESVCMKKQLLLASPFITLKDSIEYFDFEEDFVEEGIRCIPMIVRFKLDKIGIKLKLSEWAKFSKKEKVNLATMEINAPAALQQYHEMVRQLVLQYTGNAAPEMTIDTEPVWEDIQTVPIELQNKIVAFNATISKSQWGAMSTLQRFALIKLCRPGHENRNLPIALKEFGLMA